MIGGIDPDILILGNRRSSGHKYIGETRIWHENEPKHGISKLQTEVKEKYPETILKELLCHVHEEKPHKIHVSFHWNWHVIFPFPFQCGCV
jgi:hypothetical protein